MNTYGSTYYTIPTDAQWSMTWTAQAICPDHLSYDQIGEADNMRGRVVRAFFWLMRAWPA